LLTLSLPGHRLWTGLQVIELALVSQGV
jgi:hypothetical protein